MVATGELLAKPEKVSLNIDDKSVALLVSIVSNKPAGIVAIAD